MSSFTVLEEVGRGTLSVNWRLIDAFQVDGPVEVGRQLLQVGDGHRCDSASPDRAVRRGRSSPWPARSQSPSRSSPLRPPCSGVSPASVNIFVTCVHILLADLGQCASSVSGSNRDRAARGRPVRSRQSACVESFWSWLTPKRKRAAAGLALRHARHQRGECFLSLERGDASASAGSSGLAPFLFDEVGVHAGGEVVAILLLQRRLGRVGGCVQLLPEQVVVALAELVEPSPAHLVGRESDCPSSSCRRRTGRSPCRGRRSCRWRRDRSSAAPWVPWGHELACLQPSKRQRMERASLRKKRQR